MRIRAIIVEDEKKLINVLKIKLAKFCPSVEVIGDATHVDKAFHLINEQKPDLLFLDISMPGKSGFELVEMFDEIFFEIIFVTSHSEYGIRALKLSAVDYLLKPVDTRELLDAVKKAEERIQNIKQIERYKVLKENLKKEETMNQKIAIPGSSSYKFVEINSIVRCEGWAKYTRIFLQSGELIISSYNIGIFRDLLKDHNFYLSHKSHLINIDHIKEYLVDGKVLMSDNSSVPIARRKRDDFITKFVKNK